MSEGRFNYLGTVESKRELFILYESHAYKNVDNYKALQNIYGLRWQTLGEQLQTLGDIGAALGNNWDEGAEALRWHYKHCLGNKGKGKGWVTLSITGARLELRGEMGSWESNGKRWH